MMRSLIFALTSVLLFSGCAVYSDNELAQLSQRQLRPSTLAKLERRQPLGPDDLVEMHRRGVPDPLITRQLNRVGVDSLITSSDAVRMRRAGVSPHVIDAAVLASDRFAARHLPTPVLDHVEYGGPLEIHGSMEYGWFGAF